MCRTQKSAHCNSFTARINFSFLYCRPAILNLGYAYPWVYLSSSWGVRKMSYYTDNAWFGSTRIPKVENRCSAIDNRLPDHLPFALTMYEMYPARARVSGTWKDEWPLFFNFFSGAAALTAALTVEAVETGPTVEVALTAAAAVAGCFFTSWQLSWLVLRPPENVNG